MAADRRRSPVDRGSPVDRTSPAGRAARAAKGPGLIRQRHARGRLAEDAAARFLEDLGYLILARNVRVGRLELDLIARDESAVVVVEVRTRQAGSWLGGLASVTSDKRRRVRCAGEALWASRFSRDPTLQTMRFDIVAVHLEGSEPPRCEHVRAAF